MVFPGNYQGQIDQNVYDRLTTLEAIDDGSDTLFSCAGGRSGVIIFIVDCANGCQDNGAGISDQCK